MQGCLSGEVSGDTRGGTWTSLTEGPGTGSSVGLVGSQGKLRHLRVVKQILKLWEQEGWLLCWSERALATGDGRNRIETERAASRSRLCLLPDRP